MLRFQSAAYRPAYLSIPASAGMRVKGRPSADKRRTLAKRYVMQLMRAICDGPRHGREAINVRRAILQQPREWPGGH